MKVMDMEMTHHFIYLFYAFRSKYFLNMTEIIKHPKQVCTFRQIIQFVFGC